MRNKVIKQNGIPVRGEITIDITRKHGKREHKVYNMLTTFGKSYMLANGLARQYGVNTNHLRNKIRIQGKDSDTSVYANQTGPYLNDYQSVVTTGSRICNLLLSNPTLNVNKSLYIPSLDDLSGFAFTDTASTASLKEGIVAPLADNTRVDNAIVRRFQYGADLACEFDTIAMSTKAPGGSSSSFGRVVPQFRSIMPITYSSGDHTIEYVGLHLLSEGKLIFKDSATDMTYTLNLESGIIVQGGDANIQSGYSTASGTSYISAFKYNNYTYVTYWYSPMYGSRYMKYDVYDSTGTRIAHDLTAAGENSIVYYNNKFYAAGSSTWYEMVENESGILQADTSSSIAAPVTLDSNYNYNTCGDALGGYTVFGYTAGTSLQTVYFLDTDYAVATQGYTTKMLFSYNGVVYSVGAGEAQTHNWANKVDGLIEFGNLLSFHTLSETITKNVGDLMYVTYAYTMN